MPSWTTDSGISLFPLDDDPEPKRRKRSKYSAVGLAHKDAAEAVRLAERALLKLADEAIVTDPHFSATARDAAAVLCRQREKVDKESHLD